MSTDTTNPIASRLAQHERARLALEREIRADIPLTRAMDVRVPAWTGEVLTLAAPLAPNVNDKGCAFGGSLVSVMTLAGWGVVKLLLESRGYDCDIYVQDSAVRYLAPVWGDFTAIATLAEGEQAEALFASLDARGKGRARVLCRVPLAEGGDAATLEARFVAIVTKR